MPKLAIIDQMVSAGGVERFLHGLIGGAIEARIDSDWEIVLVRARYNSANIHVSWPEYLRSRNLHIQYLGEHNPLSRVLNRPGRIYGIRGTWYLKRRIGDALRFMGPRAWKAYVGDTRAWIEEYVEKNDFDLVYFSYPFYLDPPRLTVPMVATPHDFIYKHKLSTTPALYRVLDSQMPKWLDACSQVVVSSQFVADEMGRFYPAWAHKARVIRLGIPSAERIPTDQEVGEFRERNGLPEQFILVVGWIVEHKNHRVVFEAIAKLRDRGLRIPVVCVGPNSDLLNSSATRTDPRMSSSYLGKILEFCDSAGLKNGSDYFSLGFVDDFTVACLYRSATMLVVPTLVEAGSFPAREAMAAGCPVAYAQVPVYEEEIRLVEGNALGFPPHDSTALANLITWVVNNPVEVSSRAAAAKKIVSSVYSWKNTARAYFSLFEQIIDLRRSALGEKVE